MTVQRRNPDDLALWQLREYRRDLESAITNLPETSAARDMYVGRLREVITEQEARSLATGIQPYVKGVWV